MQKRYGLTKLLNRNEVYKNFWKAFEATKFDSDEDSCAPTETENEQIASSNSQKEDERRENKEKGGSEVSNDDDKESEQDTEEFLDVSENENLAGEHVGYDGEEERSEDESMDEEDLLFLNDQLDEENAGPSPLALLNADRFRDDETALKRFETIFSNYFSRIISFLRLFRRRPAESDVDAQSKCKKRKL